jgi:hypothetical protein
MTPLEAALKALDRSQEFKDAVAALPQESVALDARKGKLNIDLNWLLGQLPTLIPLLLTLFTGGGLSPALITAIVNIIAQLLGVTPAEAQKLLSQAQVTGGTP